MLVVWILRMRRTCSAGPGSLFATTLIVSSTADLRPCRLSIACEAGARALPVLSTYSTSRASASCDYDRHVKH